MHPLQSIDEPDRGYISKILVEDGLLLFLLYFPLPENQVCTVFYRCNSGSSNFLPEKIATNVAIHKFSLYNYVLFNLTRKPVDTQGVAHWATAKTESFFSIWAVRTP